MPIALVLVLLLGGGVSFAAENSVPGDALYPVKVSVNEEVRAALSLSAESKAEWDAKRLERRIEEAEKVAARAEVSAEAEAKVEENFDRQAEKFKSRIAELEASGKVEAAARLTSQSEAVLKVHESILVRLAGDADSSASAGTSQTMALRMGTSTPEKNDADRPKREIAGRLLLKVREVREETANSRVRTEAQVSGEAGVNTEGAARGALEALENKIKEVRAYIERSKASLGAEATLEAEAELKATEALMVQGKAKLEAKAYGEAFLIFRKAHRMAQESKLLIEKRRELNLDLPVSGTISIEGDMRGNKVEGTFQGTVGTGTATSSVEGDVKIKILPVR